MPWQCCRFTRLTCLRTLTRPRRLVFCVTKETSGAIGQTMAALVVAERHLWLNLSDLKEKDRYVLLDAMLAPTALFVDRFQEARK